MTKITISPDGSDNGHEVFLDGEKIGSIYHRVKTYNLRRYFITKWYEVTLYGKKLVDDYGNAEQYELLRDARAAIQWEIDERSKNEVSA